MTRRYKRGWRWCAWRWTDVAFNGKLDLRRLHLVQTPWFSLMLHWIPRADPQPDLHDRPVSFWSFVLRGGYCEVTPTGPLAQHQAGHGPARIYYVWPNTLTLVVAGPVVRSWGFHTLPGWVPWREYDAT